jgi:hypothetical protein
MLSAGKDDPEAAKELLVAQFRASIQPNKDWRERCRNSNGTKEGHPRVWIIGDAVHAMQPNR